MNKAILVGNLGNDAEFKVTQGGQAVLKFSLATTEKYKDKNGEKQEKTSWHTCDMWGERAEKLAKHLTKGTKLVVTGSIQYSSSGEGDARRFFTNIRVDDIEFCGGGKKPGEAAADDGIPF